jgi:hypothetical protein
LNESSWSELRVPVIPIAVTQRDWLINEMTRDKRRQRASTYALLLNIHIYSNWKYINYYYYYFIIIIIMSSVKEGTYFGFLCRMSTSASCTRFWNWIEFTLGSCNPWLSWGSYFLKYFLFENIKFYF